MERIMDWQATNQEVARSWLAFRELRAQGAVSGDVQGFTLTCAAQGGWRSWPWWFCTKADFSSRILNNPEHFLRAQDDFAFWPYADGYRVETPQLTRILADRTGRDEHALFDPQEEADATARVAFYRELQKCRSETAGRSGAAYLRWWMRDLNELPVGREKLLEQGVLLHGQSKDVLKGTLIMGMLIGAVTGLLLSLFLGLSGMPLLVFAAWMAEGSRGMESAGEWLNQNDAISGILEISVICGFVGAGLGLLGGLYWGNQRAFRIRSMAAISLSLARMEAKLNRSESPAESSRDPVLSSS
jgi:hypothetical protein